MTEEDKNALLQYEELKIEEKKIKEKLEELKPTIAPLISEGMQLEAKSGFFELRVRPTWKFSKAVADKEAELEKLKAEEQRTGVAKKGGTTYIQYNPNKAATEEE